VYARTKSRVRTDDSRLGVFGRFDRCEIDGPVGIERFRLFFSMVTTGHQQAAATATSRNVHSGTVPIFLLHRYRSAIVGTHRRQHGNTLRLIVDEYLKFFFFSCFEFSRGISYLDIVHRSYTYAICYCVHRQPSACL